MTLIRPSPPKSHVDLAREWDQLAEERHRQIVSGDDVSFHHVVAPATRRLLEGADHDVVLDVGAGTGEFTLQLARGARRVVAVEPSRASMHRARQVCRDATNVRYVEAALEEAVGILDEGPATAAVAMTRKPCEAMVVRKPP